MSIIEKIIKAWWISYNPTPAQSKLAQKRLEICSTCPSMIESTVFKFKCKECGCPIGKKIFTDRIGACPLHKWDIVEK